MKTGVLVALALVFLVSLTPLQAQSASTAAIGSVPEPYTADEFPSWAIGVRRFEIISLGAFPILLFYARVGYDLQRYVTNDFNAIYAPWPFKNESSYIPATEEQLQSVITAAGLSLTLAAIDAILLAIRP